MMSNFQFLCSLMTSDWSHRDKMCIFEHTELNGASGAKQIVMFIKGVTFEGCILQLYLSHPVKFCRHWVVSIQSQAQNKNKDTVVFVNCSRENFLLNWIVYIYYLGNFYFYVSVCVCANLLLNLLINNCHQVGTFIVTQSITFLFVVIVYCFSLLNRWMLVWLSICSCFIW